MTLAKRHLVMSPEQNVEFAFDMAILTMRVYCDVDKQQDLRREMEKLKAAAVAAVCREDKA